MRNVLFLIVVIVSSFSSSLAGELKNSGRSEIWDNPFVAYGYNPMTKTISGYLAVLRIAPGRTDECKLAFSGNLDESTQISVSDIISSKKISKNEKGASLVAQQDTFYLKFVKKKLLGNCEWILPFVVETEPAENLDEVSVKIEVQHAGSWIAVYTISSQKARFHDRPDSSAVQKAYLVKGDVVYVYDELPDWYFVKYEMGKRKTEGWIKKADVLQP